MAPQNTLSNKRHLKVENENGGVILSNFKYISEVYQQKQYVICIGSGTQTNETAQSPRINPKLANSRSTKAPKRHVEGKGSDFHDEQCETIDFGS